MPPATERNPAALLPSAVLDAPSAFKHAFFPPRPSRGGRQSSMRPAFGVPSRLVGFRQARPGGRAHLPPWPARRCLSQQPAGPLSQLLAWKPAEKVDNVVARGFVRSARSTKRHSFIAIGDGSSLEPMQALVPADQAEGLSVGAAVRFVGAWVPSPGAGQSHELHVDRVELLGPSDAKTYPIQKKYQTSDYLRTMPHLRPRTPFNSALLRLRSDAVASLTHFFAERMFTQTHPPIITSSDCEGAGEVFAIEPPAVAAAAKASAPTPAEALESPSAEHGGGTAGSTNPSSQESPFFRSPKYLTVSSQLHLEALAQAVGNVWTLSPTFRAERSDTSRHLSEFYMLEAEMAFVDQLGPVMDLAEDMLRSLSSHLHSKSAVVGEMLSPAKYRSPELAPLDQVRRRWEGMMLQQPWPRITYTEALDLLSPRADMFEHRPTWGAGLQSEHEKFIASFVGEGQKPVFVTEYPRDIKAFYMLPTTPSAPAVADGQPPRSTVECFDLLVPDLCEIAGGSMREHRLAHLLGEMQTRGMTTPGSEGSDSSEAGAPGPSSRGSSLDWYVELRRWGCPPHGGFGLGFDRLLCYLSGVQTIRDIVAFPRWLGRCDC